MNSAQQYQSTSRAFKQSRPRNLLAFVREGETGLGRGQQRQHRGGCGDGHQKLGLSKLG